MVEITAAEKKVICQKLPHVHITRTMRQDSKRHHYYMEEAKSAMCLLAEMRGTQDQKH